MQGQHDTSLNDCGQRQASVAARFLGNIPLARIYCSTLRRGRDTASAIAEANIGRPDIVCSGLLDEIALGVLEGELGKQQSTAALTEHYRRFSRDEVHYRVPGGETLGDVFCRVERFFSEQQSLVEGGEVSLIVGHRNVNRMILKSLLGLSFEEGVRVEHEHQRFYFYFCVSRELWSRRLGSTPSNFTKGYATTASL